MDAVGRELGSLCAEIEEFRSGTQESFTGLFELLGTFGGAQRSHKVSVVVELVIARVDGSLGTAVALFKRLVAVVAVAFTALDRCNPGNVEVEEGQTGGHGGTDMAK